MCAKKKDPLATAFVRAARLEAYYPVPADSMHDTDLPPLVLAHLEPSMSIVADWKLVHRGMVVGPHLFGSPPLLTCLRVAYERKSAVAASDDGEST